MAEYVALRTEDMIPEFEKMKQLNLFDKNEIRTIAKKRKEFEYKIQRRTKCKEDHLRYIQYEMELMRLIKIRREKNGLTHKKADLEFSIAQRINKLFKSAVVKFKDDARVWISYIKFCNQMHFRSFVGRALKDMLLVHFDKPNMWGFAATWEFSENNSIENARQYLLRGLRYHPTSKDLYTEAFRLELQYCTLKRKQQAKLEALEKKSAGEGSSTTVASSSKEPQEEAQQSEDEVSDQVLEGRLAEMIFDSAMKKVPDVKFLVELLAMAMKYDFTDKLQRKMILHMLNNFSSEELTWDTMARRELQGLHYVVTWVQQQQVSTNQPKDAFDKMNKKMKPSLKDRIRWCSEVYLSAVDKLPSEKMWSMYLELLLELYQDQSHLKNFKRNLLKNAFQHAHSTNLLLKKYYLIWVEMLKSMGKLEKVAVVLKVATDRNPQSIELWHVRLHLHLSRDDEKDALTVFQTAMEKLGKHNPGVLPLWKMMIQYYHIKDPLKVELLYKEAITPDQAIAVHMKPMYLEWLVLNKGIGSARKTYRVIGIEPPLCLELHTKMAALESYQPHVNLKLIRKCHELACLQFGKDNTDVWMEFIKFEQKQGDAKYVSEIYAQAVKNLDPSLADSFISEFSMLKTGMSIPIPMDTTPA